MYVREPSTNSEIMTELMTYTGGCHCGGIQSFYRPRSHPEGYDVNLRCLDGNVISQFQITPFDGAHWEEQIEQIQEKYS